MSAVPLYCLDTHAVYWQRIESPKLSATAARVFDDAIEGKAILVVSYVVVAELFYLLQKHGAVDCFGALLEDLRSYPYYRLEPVALADLSLLDSMAEVTEMHDRLIALMAKRLSATIVTKDRNLRACTLVRCIW